MSIMRLHFFSPGCTHFGSEYFIFYGTVSINFRKCTVFHLVSIYINDLVQWRFAFEGLFDMVGTQVDLLSLATRSNLFPFNWNLTTTTAMTANPNACSLIFGFFSHLNRELTSVHKGSKR